MSNFEEIVYAVGEMW